MDRKYVIMGFNIVIVSLIFAIIGFTIDNYMIAGVGFSTMIYGVVILSIGASITSPLEALLETYTSISIDHYSKLLEDIGLHQKHKIYTCPDKKLIVIAEDYLGCNKIVSGIGLAGSRPYLSIGTNTPVAGSDLKTLLVSFGFSRIVRVRRDDKGLLVELEGLNPAINKFIRGPLNPLRLMILASILSVESKSFMVIDEEMGEARYAVRGVFVEED